MAEIKYLTLDNLKHLKEKMDAEYLNESEVNTAITNALNAYKTGIVQIVSELPESGEEGILYILPDINASSSDVYTVYAWEKTGDDYAYRQLGATTFSLTVDSALSDTSTNSVQNKVIKAKFDEIATADATLTARVTTLEDTTIPAIEAAYKAADTALKTELEGKIDTKLTASDLVAITDAEIDALF